MKDQKTNPYKTFNSKAKQTNRNSRNRKQVRDQKRGWND